MTALGLLYVYSVAEMFRRIQVQPRSGGEQPMTSTKRIAVAITITRAGETHYSDLFAAISQSVYQWQLNSQYRIDKIAFVHVGAEEFVEKLRFWGFQVILKDIPVQVEELRNPQYKASAPKSGCCGLAELIKLYAYTLVDYYRVLHIDADVLVLRNIDHLIDMPDQFELIHTRSTFPEEILSGGFLLVKPNLNTFDEIMEIIRKGDFRYDGSGWGGSRVGYCWGGETVQGVLPYYYLVYRPETHKLSNTSLILDQCLYNHQYSDLCNSTDPNSIYVIHMSTCQKPFLCDPMGHIPLCAFHHQMWWEFTHQALDRMHIAINPRCKQNAHDDRTPRSYVPIKYKKKTQSTFMYFSRMMKE
jgi:hypothetical protein